MKYTDYTVKEFATLVKENSEIIQEIMREASSYVNNPKDGIKHLVEASSIKEENKEEVINYIYYNLYNSNSPRFYTGRGYTNVYSTPCNIF